jgi:hypothetical protein
MHGSICLPTFTKAWEGVATWLACMLMSLKVASEEIRSGRYTTLELKECRPLSSGMMCCVRTLGVLPGTSKTQDNVRNRNTNRAYRWCAAKCPSILDDVVASQGRCIASMNNTDDLQPEATRHCVQISQCHLPLAGLVACREMLGSHPA